MAKYTVPGQGISYDIPDDGEVFLIDDRGWTMGVRQGNDVLQYSLEDIGREALLKENPAWRGDGSTARSKASQILQQQGINVSGAKYYDTTPWQRGYIGSFQRGTDLSLLNSAPVAQKQGEVFTAGASASNPHAPVVTSDKGFNYDPVAQGIAPATAQPGALPAPGAGYVNPNAPFNQTGSTASFTQDVQQNPTGQNVNIINEATGETRTTPLANTASVSPAPQGQNAVATPPVNEEFFLKPGETIEAYNSRIAKSYANLPAPGTTSSTGITNTATAAPSITGSSLTPTPTPTFTQPTPTTPYNVAGIDSLAQLPPLTATPQETQAQGEINTIRGLNTQAAGRAAEQSRQETAAGIPELYKTQNDLASRLKTLQAEAAAIPQQLQLDSEGRGRTGAGIRPLETGALRINAIQSLMIGAQLDATKGLLTSAQDKADRVVKQIYDPIEAQIKAAKENLNLLLDSPETTLADKNRAQQQLNRQNEIERAIAQQKTNTAEVLKTANTAAANGAPASIIDAISKARTPIEAVQIAGRYLKEGAEWSEPYSLGGDLVQKNAKTGEIRTAVNVSTGSSAGGLPKITLTSDDTRNLAGAGFSTTEMQQIKNDITNYGIDAVLQGISDPTQKRALEKTFGVQPKITKDTIAASVTQKSTQDALTDTYTDDELRAFAEAAGFTHWYSSWETEKEKYLNSPEAKQKYIDLLYEQYRSAGMAE